jgi:hypothetical protein
MDTKQFWTMIEAAWETVGGYKEQRRLLAQGQLDEDGALDLQDALFDVVPALENNLNELGKEELFKFDHILERKLYEIDRAEIQEQTDGSDDGFLYARGFIVAMGEEYYTAVNKDSKKALMDFECEDICYLSYHLYENKFGDMPESEISRESCTNPNGWPDVEF